MCAESKAVYLAFDWLQQSLMCNCVNSVERMKFYGRLGGSSSANAIFRLANKFSMRYYQFGVARRHRAPYGSDSPAPATPINLFHIRTFWFSAFHDDIDVRSLRLLFICKFIPFCLHRFGQYLLVDLLLFATIRFKNIEALPSVYLTLVVSSSVNLPLLSRTRRISCLLIGIDTKSQYVNDGSDSRRRSPRPLV